MGGGRILGTAMVAFVALVALVACGSSPSLTNEAPVTPAVVAPAATSAVPAATAPISTPAPSQTVGENTQLPTAAAAAVIDTLKAMHVDGEGLGLTECPAGTAADWKAVAPELFVWDGSGELTMGSSVGDGGIHCALDAPDSSSEDGAFASMEIDSVDAKLLANLDEAASIHTPTPLLGGQLFGVPGQALWYDTHLEILLGAGERGQFNPFASLEQLVPVVVTHLAAADPASLPKRES